MKNYILTENEVKDLIYIMSQTVTEPGQKIKIGLYVRILQLIHMLEDKIK